MFPVQRRLQLEGLSPKFMSFPAEKMPAPFVSNLSAGLCFSLSFFLFFFLLLLLIFFFFSPCGLLSGKGGGGGDVMREWWVRMGVGG